MSRIGKLTLVTASAWFVTFAAFVARPTSEIQILSILFTLGLLGFGLLSLAQVLSRWHIERWRVFIPPFGCLLAVVLAPEVGAEIHQLIFRRALPRYEAIIQKIELGTIPVSSEMRRIPEAEGGSTYGVYAYRATNDVLNVEFLDGGGFPVKHSGYLYCSSGVIDPGSQAQTRWRRAREVRPKWFRISD